LSQVVNRTSNGLGANNRRNTSFVVSDARFEVVKTAKTQVAVSCVVTPCSDVVGYQRFEGPCCLHYSLLPHPYTASESRKLLLEL